VDEDLLSIGPFAAASGLSIRSLRHYDEIGLLRPSRTDGATGYRYYELAQLRDARAIRRLRDLDVPLEIAARALRTDDAGLRALLREHRERVASAAETAGWILAELDLVIDGREALVPPTDIEIDVEDVPELRLAAVMRQLHDDEVETEIPRMLDAVERWLAERGTPPADAPVAVFRSGDAPGWHLVEAGWPTREGVESDGVVGVHVYDASRAAVHEHRGAYAELAEVSPAFIAAVAERGLRPSQAIRVVYLRDPAKHPPEDLRARLVWPVRD
jgi:DNA-binding transcriptional MerR regulator